jgi:hypothetical protein
MTVAPAGLRSILLPELIVCILFLGMLLNMLVAYVMLATVVLPVSYKSVLQALTRSTDMATRLVVIALDVVSAITPLESAAASLASLALAVSTRLPSCKVVSWRDLHSLQLS